MKFRKLLWMLITLMICVGSGSLLSTESASADTYFKPIRGIRRTVKNTDAIARKRQIKKKIRTQRTKIAEWKGKIVSIKVQLHAYEKIQTETENAGTVFADNGRSTNLFAEVSQFDKYFKNIENYGYVNEDLVSTNGLESAADEDESLRLASLVSKDVNTVTLLKSDNTDAVDIGPYLSYVIYKKQGQVHKWNKRIKASQKKLRSLKKKQKAVVTKKVVFNADNVREVSNITTKRMKQILKGTKLQRFAGVYVKIEKEYGINAIAMCALSAYESGWGKSRRAVNDHNYTGFGVYSDSARGINANSGEENLLMTAKHLAKCYLQKGDVYYHGRGLDGLNRSYSTAGCWAYDIEHIAGQLMDKLQAVS